MVWQLAVPSLILDIFFTIVWIKQRHLFLNFISVPNWAVFCAVLHPSSTVNRVWISKCWIGFILLWAEMLLLSMEGFSPLLVLLCSRWDIAGGTSGGGNQQKSSPRSTSRSIFCEPTSCVDCNFPNFPPHDFNVSENYWVVWHAPTTKLKLLIWGAHLLCIWLWCLQYAVCL